MRALSIVVLCSSIAVLPLVAQQAERSWQVRLAVGWQGFSGGATDNSSPVELEIRPSNTVGFELGLARRWDRWECRVDGGYTSARFLGESEDVAIVDKTTQSARLRGSLTLARDLVRAGANSLRLEIGPTLDYWDTEGISSSVAVGGRVGLGFLVPMGRLTLENNASFGISSSPFDEADIPSTGKTKALTTLGIGAALRYRL